MDSKTLTALTHHDVKFAYTSGHHTVFKTLIGDWLEVPILHYPDPSKCHIVYTDDSDNACGAQLSQEHYGQELPVAFLSYTFIDTQWKWSTTEQEAYGIYYDVTKWNYYLQKSNIVVYNDHKPLQKFLNSKNAKNKVNRWSLELTTYNIIFVWISGAHNKAADCLLQLVDVKDTPTTFTASINMLITSIPDGPATHTHSKTCNPRDTTPPTDLQTTSKNDKVNALAPLIEDHKDTLQLMQRTDPCCKHISK